MSCHVDSRWTWVVNCWLTVIRMLANCHLTDDWQLADSQPTVGGHELFFTITKVFEMTSFFPSLLCLVRPLLLCFKVWDAHTGALTYSLGPHPDCVRSASFSQDNKFICTGCDDGTVRVSIQLTWYQALFLFWLVNHSREKHKNKRLYQAQF